MHLRPGVRLILAYVAIALVGGWGFGFQGAETKEAGQPVG